MEIKRIAVLFSGSGTNLDNLIKNIHKKSFDDFSIEIVGTLSNKGDAGGIQIAKDAGIECKVLDHKEFDSREAFDQSVVEYLKSLDVDLVVLAGFMRILTPVFTEQVKSINLHPSLLPLYKGTRAIERSYEGDEEEAGVSIHWVSSELDSGEIILQNSFKKSANMAYDDFYKKIKEAEYEIFPKGVLEALKED